MVTRNGTEAMSYRIEFTKALPSQHIDIIKEELDKYNLSGIWKVIPGRTIKKLLVSDNGVKRFDASRPEAAGKVIGIRIFTMPTDRYSTMSHILIPPQNYIVEDVLAMLRRGVVTPESEPEQSPQQNVEYPDTLSNVGDTWAKGTIAHRFTPGTVYWATVERIDDNFVTVKLLIKLLGVVPISAWPTMQALQPCVGEVVKVMLVEINDRTMVFDRASVVDYPDESVIAPFAASSEFTPNLVNGTISMRGFIADPSNAVWLLETLALEYAKLCADVDANGAPFPSTPQITKLWEEAICTRFSCERVASTLSPIFRSFVTREWLVPRGEHMSKAGRPSGYALTKLGWSEAHALEFGEEWLDKLYEYDALHESIDSNEEEFLADIEEPEVYIGDNNVPPQEWADTMEPILDGPPLDEEPPSMPEHFTTTNALFDENSFAASLATKAKVAVVDQLLAFKGKIQERDTLQAFIAEKESELDAMRHSLQEINNWLEEHTAIFESYKQAERERMELLSQRAALDERLKKLDQIFDASTSN